MDGSTGVDDVDAVALEQLGILSNEGMGDDGMEADMGFADMEADFDGMEIGGEEEQPPAPQAAPADMGGGDGATNGNSEMVADLSSSGESKHDEDLDLDADDLNADDLEPKDLPEHACRYCGIHNPASVALCLGTGKWFCNARLGMPASCIVQHLVRSRKSAVKLHKESPLGDSMLECYNCGNHNVFMLGFVPTKKDGVVVLICRKCMLLNTMKDMFELEKWTSLIEDKAFLPWLLKSPSDKEQLRARQVTTGQINKLEECWKTQPEATWEDLAKAEGEEDGASVQHVLANYTDGYQYQNVFGPLVKLEADEDRSLKESLGKTDVKIIWEDGLSGKRVAHFHFRESYGYASSHLEVVVGDELALRLAAAVSHTGKDWECSGRVVNIDDLGNVELEVDTRHSKSRSRTSVTEGFSVEFVWKSVTYDRMQEALKTFAISDRSVSGYLYHKLLGHDVVDQPLPVRLPENFNAPNLPALNESQTNALRQVLTRPLALIQGPPGTGKTVTSATLVYHLVQQNLAAQRQDNIKRQVLVTAPSNVAVDQLVEKIHMAGLNVVRLTSKTREAAVTHVEYLCLHKMVPEANPKVKQLMQLREEMGSLTNEDQRRFLREQRKTELEILNLADVICCTCATAGDKRLLDRSKRKSSSKRRGGAAKAGPRRRFQQVLIDEATQATEPEALIPVVTGAKQLILVGDHCQLPPVVICKKAKKAGLSHSLFERLVQIGMRPIRLEVQYRMHPVLSDFPSNMFYDGMLQNGVSSLDRELPGQVRLESSVCCFARVCVYGSACVAVILLYVANIFVVVVVVVLFLPPSFRGHTGYVPTFLSQRTHNKFRSPCPGRIANAPSFST
jgi:regulator of nonsense transcripts 1